MTNILRCVELRHLQCFLAAAEHGSFRKASLHMGIRESGVSRQIRHLEEHLGVVLFQRLYSGVLLTAAGQQFIEKLRLGMNHICDGADDARRISQINSGRIVVGMSSSLDSSFLAKLFRSHSKTHANIHLDFIDGSMSDHISSLRRSAIDIAFVSGDQKYNDCETRHLWTERIFAVIPVGHHLASRPALTWRDLTGETFIVSDRAPGSKGHDIFCGRVGDIVRYPMMRRQDVGRDNLMALVMMGRGLAFVSEATTSTTFFGLVYRPILGEVLRFGAVWASKNKNPALHQLLRMAGAC